MTARLIPLTLALVAGLSLEAAAQSRQVEVFYDQYGREVLLDVYTGEVVAIREPRGRARGEIRREELGRGGYDDRYRDYGRRYPAEPVYPDDEYILEDNGDDYVYPDDGYAREELPPYEEAPAPYPDLVTPGPVERKPLEQPSVIAIPGEQQQPVTGESQTATVSPDTPTILEEQPRAIPDVSQAPTISRTGATEEIAKIQILLDRVGASPGVIDGRIGDNVNKAIDAYRELTGETLRTYDAAYIDEKLAATGGDPFITYEIKPEDVAGPFVAAIPSDYGEKAKMERLGYTSVVEMLGERFHVDQKYLVALNPGIDFNKPGSIVKVPNVGKPLTGKVSRIIADKGRKQLRVYDDAGKLLAIYPSTIGSTATPSPTGTHTIERIAMNPVYTYNPKINFQQGNNTSILTIPPGPNGPVGTVWIALSKPTYGIHGTPDPEKIGKTNSNGCIRLTNWDAEELAKMVSPGVTVEFIE